MTLFSRSRMPLAALGAALVLAGCTTDALDWDMRSPTAGLNTREAARQPLANRPQADSRGVISYPGYQVVVAQRGDTVASVARRLGISAADLGRQNAIAPDVPLRQGELLVLPGRIQDSAAPGDITGGAIQSGPVDVTAIASAAIDRAEGARGTASAPAGITQGPAPVRGSDAQGVEPIRHRVAAGESVYTIARLYGVTARAIADWNGLGADLRLREGQTLLIPPGAAMSRASAPEETSAPGQGSPTPQPPSAAKPLPAETTPAASPAPASPELASQRSSTSSSRFAMPADGPILRAYVKKKNDGIDIGAAAGSPVRAAADGTVAAITRDTDQVPIVVIRHADNLLTVYANLDGITVVKDATVKRGQTIGKVRGGNPSFVHFEVRQGLESLDPMPFLQ